MAGMNADFINPFLMSATKIMQEICQTEMKIGKPYVKTTEFENKSVAVMIGITGELWHLSLIRHWTWHLR